MSRLVRSLMKAADYSAAFLFAAIVFVNAMAVFARYVLFAPLGWAEEVMRFAMVWIALLAGTVALYRGQHISIGLLRSISLPSKVQSGLVVFSHLAVAVFCIVLAVTVIPIALRNLKQIAPGSGIPFFWSYLALVVCPAVMVLVSLDSVRRKLRGDSEPGDE